jgi:hypothetical protein
MRGKYQTSTFMAEVAGSEEMKSEHAAFPEEF